MKIYTKLLIVLSIFCSLQVLADTQAFTRYIQKGDRGSDVQLLQWILNSNSDTKVADSGAGSSGNETTYFGENTKQAVIKYQKKNNLGTQYGLFTIFSGALDDKTRAALNNEALATSTATTTATSTDSTINCKVETNTDGQSKFSIFNTLFNPTTPLTLFEGFKDRATKIANVLRPDSGASMEERWSALNSAYKETVKASSTAPYIKKIVMSTGTEFLGMPTPVVTDKAKMTIYGCNFSTSTQNTIHLTYNDQKAVATTTKGGMIIELTLASTLQSMFENQLSKALDNIKDPITKEIEKQVKDNIIKKIQDNMKFSIPGTDSSSTTSSTSTSSGSEQQLPGAPLYVTVENEKGISNAYQLFLQF
ncbi:MAG: peptidoglycan-binding domain-containing protein [Candidatus Paceibacterota bacterium]|jgi:peptidoglycan hydrolase-like protein with peptidoglycan-binding domain